MVSLPTIHEQAPACPPHLHAQGSKTMQMHLGSRRGAAKSDAPVSLASLPTPKDAAVRGASWKLLDRVGMVLQQKVLTSGCSWSGTRHLVVGWWVSLAATSTRPL